MVKENKEPQQPAAPYVASRHWCAGTLGSEIMRNFAIALLLACLMGCRRDPQVDADLEWGKHMELVMENETADVENLASYLGGFIVTNGNITGQWDSWGHDDGICLTIGCESKGSYPISFYARGDLASWRLERTATFSNGVLQLNRPVKPYLGRSFTHFYLIRTPEELRFLSQHFVRFWRVENPSRKWDDSFFEYHGDRMLKKTEPND